MAFLCLEDQFPEVETDSILSPNPNTRTLGTVQTTADFLTTLQPGDRVFLSKNCVHLFHSLKTFFLFCFVLPCIVDVIRKISMLKEMKIKNYIFHFIKVKKTKLRQP